MNINSNFGRKYSLNPTAILVDGYSRGLICDLDRNKYFLIPKSLYSILADSLIHTIHDCIEKHGNSDKEIIDTIIEYYEYLLTNNLIFFTNFPEYYTSLNLLWDFPGVISNAIIDITNTSIYIDYPEIIVNQLDKLGCRFVQLRFFATLDSVNIDQIVNSFSKSTVENLDLFIPYQENIISNIENFISKYPRINSIVVYNYPIHESYNPINEIGRGKLFTYPYEITNLHCGVVKPFYFKTTIFLFTESQHHNSCLNRKISIDTEGNIKNCPSMPQSFGNIRDTTLEHV